MVYGIINLINFAHGEVLMVGALTSWTVITLLADSGLPGWLREDRVGAVNVLAWWDTNDRNELIVYGVMTDLPAHWQTYRYGKRRMWIETLFRDWQSGGFELGTSAVRDHQRFSRLLVLISLVYIWFVSVGRWLVKRGYRTRIDAGGSRAWQFSLFGLAIAWQNHLRTFEQHMPVFWHLYC